MNKIMAESELIRLKKVQQEIIRHEMNLTKIHQDTMTELRSMRTDYQNKIEMLREILAEGKELQFSGFMGE